MSTLEIPQSVKEYQNELLPWLEDLKARSGAGRDSKWADALRWYAQNDLYFLLRYILHIGQATHQPFGTPLYDHDIYVYQCRAVEHMFKKGRGVLASARALSKSEIVSCAQVIQAMVNYPDIAIGLYSVQKDYALKHMTRLRGELEKNEMLKLLFDDLLWANPVEKSSTEGVAWSKTEGLVIRGRKMNRSVPTFEINTLYGHGEVGSRYDFILFDDTETGDNVKSVEDIQKLKKAVSRAVSLLTPVALPKPVVLFANTQFSESGVIRARMDRYRAEDPRLVVEIPAEIIEEKHEWCEIFCYNDDVGPLNGRVVWPYTGSQLKQLFEDSEIPEEYVLQRCLSYKSFGEQALKAENLSFYRKPSSEMARDCTVYICIDPSLGVKDPAVFWVWGLTFDNRKVWLDGVRKKMDPTKPLFWDILFNLVSKWNNFSQGVVQVRIEEAGPSIWASKAKDELQARGCYVPVVQVKARSSDVQKKFTTGKANRNYARWAPMLNKGELVFPTPPSMGGAGIKCDLMGDGQYHDIVDYFLEHEWKPFPLSKTDDMLDAGSLIADERTNVQFPLVKGRNLLYDDEDYGFDGEPGTSWMSGA